MIVKVILHGILESKITSQLSFNVSSYREILSALWNQFPVSRKIMMNYPWGMLIGSKPVTDVQMIHCQMTSDEVTIYPYCGASGGDDIGSFVLLAGAIALTVFPFTTAFGVSALTASLIRLGAGIALQSIVSLFSETPEQPNYENRAITTESKSFLFDGAFNRSDEGAAIPIIYGRVRVGSIVVSSRLNTIRIQA